MLPPHLQAEFAHRALAPDTLCLLAAQGALALIDRCAVDGYVVLGVEAFRVTDQGAYQPDQRYSNDIADHSRDQRTFITATREMVSAGGNIGLRFQVIVEDPGT